jgi:ferredoxin-like protein FixX
VVFFAILVWLSTMRSTWPAIMFTVTSIVALFSWEVFKNARAQIRMPSDELKREPGRAKLLARGVCPSCLYRLSGLRTEADGCLVCPECGAAWRRDRVREFLPPAAEQPDALPMQTPARGHSGDTTRDARLNPVLCATPTLRAERAIASAEVATRLDRIIPRLTATGRRRRVHGVPVVPQAGDQEPLTPFRQGNGVIAQSRYGLRMEGARSGGRAREECTAEGEQRATRENETRRRRQSVEGQGEWSCAG